MIVQDLKRGDNRHRLPAGRLAGHAGHHRRGATARHPGRGSYRVRAQGRSLHLQTYRRGCLAGRFGRVIDYGEDSQGRYRVQLREKDWAGKEKARWYLASTHSVIECWRDVAKER